jgi:hypothetical protein
MRFPIFYYYISAFIKASDKSLNNPTTKFREGDKKMKVRFGAEQLLSLAKAPGTRVASTPFNPDIVYVGRLAFPRGKVPEPLKGYVGQTGPVAKKCKGKTGHAFVECLVKQAKEMGITKLAKTV